MDYHDIEWFAVETNRDHPVIFEIASKYCIFDSFVDYDDYSISSKGLSLTLQGKHLPVSLTTHQYDLNGLKLFYYICENTRIDFILPLFWTLRLFISNFTHRLGRYILRQNPGTQISISISK